MTIAYDYINEDKVRAAETTNDLDKLVESLAAEYGITLDAGDSYMESAVRLENVAKLLYAADDRWLELENSAASWKETNDKAFALVTNAVTEASQRVEPVSSGQSDNAD